jgi:hypothetical protein
LVIYKAIRQQIASGPPLGCHNSHNRLQRFLRHQRTHFHGTQDTAHIFLQTWFSLLITLETGIDLSVHGTIYGKLSATPSAIKLQAVNTAAKKSTLAAYNRTSFLGKSLKQNTVETSMVLSMIMSAMRDIFIIKLLKTKVYAITS